jgi:hypothetical protein
MNQIRNIICISVSIFLLSNIFSCNHSVKSVNDNKINSDSHKVISNFKEVNHENEKTNDSTKLRDLLIEIYKWHESKGADYYFILEGKAISGIDSEKLDSTLNALKKTGFFSDEFLETYKKIGQKIDLDIRHNPDNYKDGDIYFPFQDYDTWYGGNGGTPNWDDLKIYDLSINQDNASFKWACEKSDPKDFISVRFKRENGKWKLSHLQYIDLKMY